MSIKDTITKLDQLIPVLATLTGHPELGALAQQLINIGNSELQNRAAQTGKTTDEILQEASAEWDAALQNAQNLRNM